MTGDIKYQYNSEFTHKKDHEIWNVLVVDF